MAASCKGLLRLRALSLNCSNFRRKLEIMQHSSSSQSLMTRFTLGEATSQPESELDADQRREHGSFPLIHQRSSALVRVPSNVHSTGMMQVLCREPSTSSMPRRRFPPSQEQILHPGERYARTACTGRCAYRLPPAIRRSPGREWTAGASRR
jgi:hypothetical protein